MGHDSFKTLGVGFIRLILKGGYLCCVDFVVQRLEQLAVYLSGQALCRSPQWRVTSDKFSPKVPSSHLTLPGPGIHTFQGG
jgi:hypothetical protein